MNGGKARELPRDGITVGTLRAITRFPVKSMLGEELPAAEVTSGGVDGDRAWALVDAETGKVASAKRPRLWGDLLGFRARDSGNGSRTVCIESAGGDSIRSTETDVDARLSAILDRPIRLEAAPRHDAAFEEVWPDVPGLAPEGMIAATRTGSTTDSRPISSIPVGMLAPGTFQDLAPVTILSTASLHRAARLYPAGDWDPRRFRSTLLVDTDIATSTDDDPDEIPDDCFAERHWIGRRLHVGDVTMEITTPVPRCVMVTLAQQGLPADIDILRTLAVHNRLDILGTGRYACLGVYATVARPGHITTGQHVTLS